MTDLPRVTEIIRVAGISDFSKVPNDILEASQHFGTAVHLACELDDLGTLDMAELSDPILPYLEAWRKFRKDYNLSFVKDEIEVSITSKRGFRGTPDRISKTLGLLIDIKSSVSMMPSVAIQLSAYQILAEDVGIKIKKRIGVQLKESRSYSIQEYKNPSDKTVFLSALNVYNWRKEHGLLDKSR